MFIQAPIDSAADVLRSDLPLTGWAVPALSTQPFDTASRMASLRSCLFLFVGSRDERFSVKRESDLFDRASNVDPGCSRFVVVDDLGHFDDPVEKDQFRREAAAFFAMITTDG